MALITVKQLQALTTADDGRRISMGESMYGSYSGFRLRTSNTNGNSNEQ
jgi:hypothetical protein